MAIASETKREIRRILVPLDGSVFAEHAVPLAIAIAEESGAVVQLVHVVVPNEGLAPVEMLYSSDRALREQKDRKHAYLSKIARQVSTSSRVFVSSVVTQGFDVSDALHEAYVENSDLVVMATHGRGRFGRFWWGSVAHSLLQRTSVPLVLISGSDTKPDLVPQRIENLILPIDGDKRSAAIVDPLLDLGIFPNARHTLLHVTRPELAIANRGEKVRGEWAPPANREARGAEYLQSAVKSLSENNRQLVAKIIRSEKPAWKAIGDYVNQLENSIVVCPYHRARLLERIVWPGISENLLKTLDCPLMLVPS